MLQIVCSEYNEHLNRLNDEMVPTSSAGLKLLIDRALEIKNKLILEKIRDN